jgi:hypothetical protein
VRAAGQAPRPGVEVQFIAPHTGNLADALAGDEQQLDDPLQAFRRGSAVSSPAHSLRISSSLRTRSLGDEPRGFDMPSIGLKSRSPRFTAHRSTARRSSKTRLASTGRSRARIGSTTRLTSRRCSSAIFTAPITGTTFLLSRRSMAFAVRRFGRACLAR